MLEPLNARLAGLETHDGYRNTDLPQILQKIDVGIVPPIWWDNAPQVVFEMMALGVPLIGAEIGGIPDFVTHDKNGLLFKPGDAEDLQKQLLAIVSKPQKITNFRAALSPMKTIAEHADELEAFYQNT